MNTSRFRARDRRRGLPRAAFTLVELLVVIGIISLILAMGSLGISKSIRSTAMLSSTESFGNYLQLGLQLAVKENRPVELRIYKLRDDNSGTDDAQYRAYQYVARNTSDGKVEALESLRRFSSGIIFHPNSEYTTVFSLAEKTSSTNDPEIAGEGETYSYISYQYRPDGSTTLPKDGHWSFTIVRESDLANSGELPKNYRAVTVNAFNGAVTIY